MQFEFATANRIIFGQGTLKQVPALAALFGRRVFLVADSEERCEILMNCLKELDLSVVLLVIVKEPDLNDVMLATRKAR
jgi:alcohol dehydrogenase class IV